MKKYQVLSGSVLKMIALITMMIDHTAAWVLSQADFALVPIWIVGKENITIYYICRLIGRTAFPLYCFLLAEGFAYTKNRKRYGLNLLVFAILSEPVWDLVHSGQFFNKGQNVFFTLFFGFIAMYFYERFKDKKILCCISVLGVLIFASFFGADYGWNGVGLVLFMHVMREKTAARTVLGCCFFGKQWKVVPAFAIMNLYNGKRGFIKGKVGKYLFYAAYPLHIFVLYLIRLKYFGY